MGYYTKLLDLSGGGRMNLTGDLTGDNWQRNRLHLQRHAIRSNAEMMYQEGV